MAHRRGNFHGDSNDLLERFGHRGTPAALEDQLRDIRPKEPAQRPPCPAFHLNQGLFERSQN